LLHRFVAGNASGRYNLVHKKKVGVLMPFDIALPRNDDEWHNIIPQELHDQIAAPFCLGHFFCLVIHHDFVLKKGVDPIRFKSSYLAHLDARGAKYPAELMLGTFIRLNPEKNDQHDGRAETYQSDPSIIDIRIPK